MVNIPRGTEDVYVIFTAEINPSTSEELINVMSELANPRVARVHLAISTPGGSVANGIALYNVLRGLPIELITYNIGNVDSIGNIVYLAGDRRYVDPHATFMFHGVSSVFEEATQVDATLLKEELESILSDQDRIGSIISSRSNLSHEIIAEFSDRQQTKDAIWATENGIAHDVREFHVVANRPILPISFER